MLNKETKLKKIGIVGTKHTTADLILGLMHSGKSIDFVLTLDPKKGKEQKVAGYQDLRPLLEQTKIPYYQPKKYNLNTSEDKENLLAENLDVLFVAGWQRLLPDWWLQSLTIGAFGMHGSSKPLPHGRGRSPMNWSLIQGKERFFTHLFKYEPGVDDGPIVGQQIFDITPFDTCLTLHHKNLISMRQLILKNLPSILDGTIKLESQPKIGATYYPKREAEDGLIFFENSNTKVIYDLVRAVTAPFPGAFCYVNNDLEKKIIIWRAIPFDSILDWSGAEPGHIVEVFADGDFIVKTTDASILVQEYSGVEISEKNIGTKLGSANLKRKTWIDLPD